jgi:hypothetical protein
MPAGTVNRTFPRFLVAWPIANLVGAVLGASAFFVFAYFVAGGDAPRQAGDMSTGRAIWAYGLILIGGIAFGIILGTLQAVVVNRHISQLPLWTFAVAAGVVLGMGVEAGLQSLRPARLFLGVEELIPFWAVLGASAGLLQFALLRRQGWPRAGYWPLASLACGLIAGVLGAGWGVLGGAVFWGLGSVLAGLTLVWLYNSRQS